MSFLEAKRLVDGFAGGPALPFVFALSGSAEPFDLYLRAAAARHGRSADIRLLAFNTLAQSLHRAVDPDAAEVYLLLPWDFVPEADWRSGVPQAIDEEAVRRAAEQFAALVASRGARALYLPAPMPPLLSDPRRDAALAGWIESLAIGVGAQLLPADAFSLAGYFTSGCPVGGAWIARAADSVVDLALTIRADSKKVLVTDLDNVLWSGGIAEDGIDGVSFEPVGRGFPHFVYQGFLRRLRSEGVLIAAVSRNDAEVVLDPFRSGRMVLQEDDFVAIIASYHAKSAQITELASRLNLGLDAFVFVDDNPVELTEVALTLPAVRCVPFPLRADGLPAFLAGLSALLSRRDITGEDRERTALYRRRLDGMMPSAIGGADISRFLRELDMTLTVHDRSRGDRARVVQLINKTNQFNLNGRRTTEAEVAAVLDAGGRLYGATLADRAGSHGEILACLIGPDDVVSSFVMSCRVFQRRVEYAFLGWLAAQPRAPTALAWAGTARNAPFAHFIRDLAGAEPGDTAVVALDPTSIAERCAPDLALVTLVAPGALPS